MSAIFNARESKNKRLGLVIIGLTVAATIILGPTAAVLFTKNESWFAIYGLYAFCVGLHLLHKGVSGHH